MREDFVCTFEADILHDLQEVIKELVRFDLPLVEPSPKCVELCEVFVCKEVLEFCLELFVA